MFQVETGPAVAPAWDRNLNDLAVAVAQMVRLFLGAVQKIGCKLTTIVPQTAFEWTVHDAVANFAIVSKTA
jgi:hypothetical protein